MTILRRNQCSAVLAVGGGSSIDAAKMMRPAPATRTASSPWVDCSGCSSPTAAVCRPDDRGHGIGGNDRCGHLRPASNRKFVVMDSFFSQARTVGGRTRRRTHDGASCPRDDSHRHGRTDPRRGGVLSQTRPPPRTPWRSKRRVWCSRIFRRSFATATISGAGSAWRRLPTVPAWR